MKHVLGLLHRFPLIYRMFSSTRDITVVLRVLIVSVNAEIISFCWCWLHEPSAECVSIFLSDDNMVHCDDSQEKAWITRGEGDESSYIFVSRPLKQYTTFYTFSLGQLFFFSQPAEHHKLSIHSRNSLHSVIYVGEKHLTTCLPT